jgi:tRNA/tmRNA/rRNA uracil-C5-methylase (TrmA/RlmC/RlmD family)
VTDRPESWVGRELVVDVGPIAHGGHCVARHEGRVVFVRHAIPGERVGVIVTEGGEGSRYLRADAVDIVAASPDRVAVPCPHAGPGRCGGCDFQHIGMTRQRELLGDVVREQLTRLAGIERAIEVESVPGDVDGLGWRTRMQFRAAADGGLGLRRHRSHDVEPLDRCLIAHPDLPDARPAFRAGAEQAEAVVSSTGERVIVTDRRQAAEINETAVGRTFRVQAGDFWQVHPGAAGALAAAVLEGLAPGPADRCWDLYAGVGLFSAVLARAVGADGRVVAVESHGRAAAHGRANLADLPQVRWVGDRVDRFVRSRIAQGRLDLVVLDPPRAGAGAAVVSAVARQQPRAIAYVACDPASLARDLATLTEAGYQLDSLRAFDIFPMTHHVECVAICRPRRDSAEH